MADNWELIGKSSTSPRSNTNRAVVSTRVPKTENIIFIGSEYNYDSFWLKNMFIAAAYPFVKDRAKFRICDKVTIAYIDYGYSNAEKLAIENLKNEILSEVKEVKAIKNHSDMINIFKNDRSAYKIQDVAIFSHGLNGKITLNYNKKPDINLLKSDITNISSNSFMLTGKLYSYACRTGMSDAFSLRLTDTFRSIAEAKPDDSLAQSIADHFDIEVHAFYVRSFYGDIIRQKSKKVNNIPISQIITNSLVTKKELIPNSSIINLYDGATEALRPFEALKHRGLAESGFNILGIKSGAVGEGTNGYSLWRKTGGRALPVGATDIDGLPRSMQVFNKK